MGAQGNILKQHFKMSFILQRGTQGNIQSNSSGFLYNALRDRSFESGAQAPRSPIMSKYGNERLWARQANILVKNSS